jgi:hypothetical protein
MAHEIGALHVVVNSRCCLCAWLASPGACAHTFASATPRVRPSLPADYSVFVGDLAFEVDDQLLSQTFSTYYPSVKQSKVKQVASRQCAALASLRVPQAAPIRCSPHVP